jgi:hypothetical protein
MIQQLDSEGGGVSKLSVDGTGSCMKPFRPKYESAKQGRHDLS